MSRAVRAAAAAAALSCVLAAPAHATLAYVRGALQGKPVVWVASDDGTGAHALAPGGTGPRVSPDGTQVAYVTGARVAKLVVRPVAGGPARTLASRVWSFDAIHWSADGSMLSVVTGPELGPYALRLVDVAAGTSRIVAHGAFYGASFCPGNAFVYARAARETYPVRADLYVRPAAGGAAARITTTRDATDPVCGPERIAYSRSRRPPRRSDHDKLDIYTVAPGGGASRRVTTTRPRFLLAGLTPLAWSADGTRLAAEFGGQDTSEAWRVNPQSGAAADATGGFDGVVGWGLSRDGTTLLATTGSFDDPNGDVIALAWDGAAQAVLARHAAMPDWSR